VHVPVLHPAGVQSGGEYKPIQAEQDRRPAASVAAIRQSPYHALNPPAPSAPSPRFPLQQAMPHTPKTASPVVAPVILRVAVPSPLRRLFDYLPPADLSDASAAGLVPGMRVAVPFGTRTLVAILVSVQTRSSVCQRQAQESTAPD
jgi:hypothetical protein